MIDSVYWIWFQQMFGIATLRSEEMFGVMENPAEFYSGLESGGREQLLLKEEELELVKVNMDLARQIQDQTLRRGWNIVTPDHPQYPSRLHPIYAKPAVLYVRGDLSCLEDSLAIAMVGTRAYSDYGAKSATALARDLALGSAVIVSGLAKGIDTICHTAALDAGGLTVGVLGCGLDKDYPSGSEPLKQRMAENGAVITEFPIGSQPSGSHFPIRNRIISGMSQGVIVVEARVRSGSIITANHALEQNREVFAVPGSIFSSAMAGTHKLIKDGAKLIDCAGDIFEEFASQGYQVLPTSKRLPARVVNSSASIGNPVVSAVKKPLPAEADELQHKLYNTLDSGEWTAEELALRVNAGISAVLSSLTVLELYGLVETGPGRKFKLSDA